MKYNPYSYSRINKYIMCPKAFKYSYILEPEGTPIPSVFQTGRALHKIAELIQKGEDFNLESIAESYVKREVQDEILKKGWEITEWLKKPNEDDYKILRFELQLAINSLFTNFNMNYWDKSVYFRGVADRVEIDKDNHLKVIDLKFWKKVELEIDMQLYLYAYCAWNHAKSFNNSIDSNITLELWNMNYHGKRTTDNVDISEIVPKVTTWLNENISKIESDKEFKAAIDDHCLFCEHRNYCDELSKAEGDEKMVTDYILIKSNYGDFDKKLRAYIKENGNISIDGKAFGNYNTERISFDGDDAYRMIKGFCGEEYIINNFHLTKTEMTKISKKFGIQWEDAMKFATVKKINNFGFVK